MPKRRSVKVENLPAKLRAVRKQLGLSQSQLADAIITESSLRARLRV